MSVLHPSSARSHSCGCTSSSRVFVTKGSLGQAPARCRCACGGTVCNPTPEKPWLTSCAWPRSTFRTGKPSGSSTAVNGLLDIYRNLTKDDNSKTQATISIDEDEPCPLECVRQIYTVNDFKKLAEEAHPKSLVVVDFYRTACGSCKYIMPGFVKLCKRSGSHAAPVVFLKHNVMDEYEERTELADHADIRAVPSFQFWMDGKKVEQFATRDKTKISLAIDKYVPGAVSL